MRLLEIFKPHVVEYAKAVFHIFEYPFNKVAAVLVLVKATVLLVYLLDVKGANPGNEEGERWERVPVDS
ncbi:hypothetical protein NPIL_286471 [Nephila pilipes]|uniref:Uncharacterized protein n=1 Tax=Nephila pilipes TaxID=299642 RepID=A0A8X6N8W1_NEPPI|nr:hypothetical protein NPIL_286471 [Nephila pilipes]